MRVMMIQGKVENIFDNEDFARMLGERLGSEAEQYFREQTDPAVVLDGLDDAEFYEYCEGDCDKMDVLADERNALEEERDELKMFLGTVEKTLKDIEDDFTYLGSLMTPDEIREKIGELIQEVKENHE